MTVSTAGWHSRRGGRLGETTDRQVSYGYLIGTVTFGGPLVVLVFAHIRARTALIGFIRPLPPTGSRGGSVLLRISK